MAVIVVIEDEPVLRQLISGELAKAGHTAYGAPNGSDGWNLITRHHPDLILLDLLMPQLSGYEVLRRLRADKTVGDTPCIVVSNSGQLDDLNRAKRLGADDVVVKADFNPDQLILKVQRLLAESELPKRRRR